MKTFAWAIVITLATTAASAGTIVGPSHITSREGRHDIHLGPDGWLEVNQWASHSEGFGEALIIWQGHDFEANEAILFEYDFRGSINNLIAIEPHVYDHMEWSGDFGGGYRGEIIFDAMNHVGYDLIARVSTREWVNARMRASVINVPEPSNAVILISCVAVLIAMVLLRLSKPPSTPREARYDREKHQRDFDLTNAVNTRGILESRKKDTGGILEMLRLHSLSKCPRCRQVSTVLRDTKFNRSRTKVARLYDCTECLHRIEVTYEISGIEVRRHNDIEPEREAKSGEDEQVNGIGPPSKSSHP